MSRIYLDHNATTRTHPEVRAAMTPYLEECFGNPSSMHMEGRRARDAVERARREVAAFLGAAPEEIIFTSGGTEGDNLAIRGAAHAIRRRSGRTRIVSSPLEHPAVRASLEALAAEGFDVRLVPVLPDGSLDLAAFGRLLDEHTALVTLQLANHELGHLYPISQIAGLAHAVGALVHTDAVQAAGKVPLDAAALGVDLLTLSGHKMYGPKGVGAIYQRRGVELDPLVAGGHQERERRGGTENVAAIVGLGAACAIARREQGTWAEKMTVLRDRLEAGALAIPGARRFGGDPRVPGTTNLGFAGVEGELVLAGLDLAGVAVSTGAACTSGSLDPSPVLLALGLDRQTALTAVRFSLGRETTAEEIDHVLGVLPEIVARVRRVDAQLRA
jgi:cysteine desulfurase